MARSPEGGVFFSDTWEGTIFVIALHIPGHIFLGLIDFPSKVLADS